MDLSVNRFSNTSFCGFNPAKILTGENGKVAVQSAEKVFEILGEKPSYVRNTGKKVIQYPVLINGKPAMYSIKYRTSQHNVNGGVGYEILQANPQEYQKISAREIAKDLDRKAYIADQKANGVNVFWA